MLQELEAGHARHPSVADDHVDILDRIVEELLRLASVPGRIKGMTVHFSPLGDTADKALDSAFVDLGVEEGAELVVDGRGLTLQGYEDGYFIGGCLFDRVRPERRSDTDERGGPVLSVVRADDYESALSLVNDHEFGNGAAIFTRDGDAARDFADRVQIGMVGVNTPIPVPVAYYSFGGWKRSLFGDHHMHGAEGVRFYTRAKYVTSRWPSGIREGAEYVMPTLK